MVGRFETFSFLPPLSANQIASQVDTLLADDQVLLIEYTENPDVNDLFWKNWQIPEKKDMASTWIVAQLDACARRNPYSYIRLSGYCPTEHKTTQSFIVRAPTEQN